MCYEPNDRPPLPPGAPGLAHGEDRVLTADDGNRFAVYVAWPEQAAHAQVVIYPDVRGLHQFYKDLALRFAEQGVAALALDYFGRTAGLSGRGDDFEYMPHVGQMGLDTFLADVHASLAAMRAERPHTPVYTLGFCMGGTLSLMTGAEDLGLAGVVSFYAGLTRDYGEAGTALSRAPRIKYPVLSMFGGADQHITPDMVAALDEALDASGMSHTVITYPGAPHSFFDRKATEYAEASSDAWSQVLGFMQAGAIAST